MSTAAVAEKKKIERVPHDERANLRAAAVSEAISTKNINAVAKKYGKTNAWLIKALKDLTAPDIWQSIVPAVKRPLGAKGMFRVVAALIAGEQESMIAARFGISREWVNQIKVNYVESGLRDAVQDAIKAGAAGKKGSSTA